MIYLVLYDAGNRLFPYRCEFRTAKLEQSVADLFSIDQSAERLMRFFVKEIAIISKCEL